MSELQREILLGYLSGALDEAENRKVQRELERNESWQIEFATLRKEMRPLAKYAKWSELACQPPKGLAKQTCSRIWNQLDNGQQMPGLAEVKEATLIPIKRNPPRIYGAFHRNSKQGKWKSANVIATVCLGVMAVLLFFPAFQFVKNQVVHNVRQKTIKRIVDNTAALSQIHEGYIFQQNVGDVDYSVIANAGRTDLGTFLTAFREMNLSQKTLDFFSPEQQGSRTFITSPHSSATTLVDRIPLDSQSLVFSQYIQSLPFPQISHLFDPLMTGSSQFPLQATGLAFVEWDGISSPVFAQSRGNVEVSDEQHLIFRDGRVFFRKVGNR
jgi:hypothetical protein